MGTDGLPGLARSTGGAGRGLSEGAACREGVLGRTLPFMDLPNVDDLLDLQGRVALVTGAGGGIGAAVARRLAEAGADVAVHFRSNETGARETAARVKAAGVSAVTLQADITDPEQVEEMFRHCGDSLGTPDILVNNAGIYPVSSILDMNSTEWDEVVRVNLHGVHHCTRAAAAGMIARGRGGAIVNISSIEGEVPMPGHAHYNAAKAGVTMHTRTAAAELGPHDIRVNTVAPGLIGRDGLEEDWPEGVTAWREGCPLGRVGEPDDVADACLFLLSRAARWITGTTLVVDGGYLSRGMM